MHLLGFIVQRPRKALGGSVVFKTGTKSLMYKVLNLGTLSLPIYIMTKLLHWVR